MKKLLEELKINEKNIDDHIKSIKFRISITDIRNHINWILSLNQIDQIFKNDKENIDGSIDSLTSVYTYLRGELSENMERSLEWDGDDHNYNEILKKEVFLLCKYKMLFNILPLVYRANKNIYKLEKEGDEILVKYSKVEYLKLEFYDILFTRISLFVNFNNIFHSNDELKLYVINFFQKMAFIFHIQNK